MKSGTVNWYLNDTSINYTSSKAVYEVSNDGLNLTVKLIEGTTGWYACSIDNWVPSPECQHQQFLGEVHNLHYETDMT